MLLSIFIYTNHFSPYALLSGLKRQYTELYIQEKENNDYSPHRTNRFYIKRVKHRYLYVFCNRIKYHTILDQIKYSFVGTVTSS